jgi:hypothetical protein
MISVIANRIRDDLSIEHELFYLDGDDDTAAFQTHAARTIERH